MRHSGVDVSGGKIRSQNIAGQNVNIRKQVNVTNVQRQSSEPKPRAIYLPPKPTNFVGRDSYFDQLRTALVVKPGMFLLSGDPGSGKSTLAMMFAWQVQQKFKAVVFQACGTRSMEMIVGDLANLLKEQIGDLVQLPAQQKVRTIRNWLQQQKTLLVLDDVYLEDESVTSQEPVLNFQDLLPGPPVSVLFTSRRPALPWIEAEHRIPVDAFSVDETEEVFRSYLGKTTVEQNRQQLLEFAEKVERLPLAVSAAAQLLQNQFGPLEEAARNLKLEELRTGTRNVRGLLQRAIEAQGPEERRLLLAAAVCAPEGFWLPLTISIAGLSSSQGGQARDDLVNAGLLRILDRDRQRFNLHALLRDLLQSDSGINEFRYAHARALKNFFDTWETQWKECHECLPEIPRAVEFLWSGNSEDPSWLSYRGYQCALRIGELETALQIENQNERFWSSVAGEKSKYGLQASYGNQAVILQVWGGLKEAMALSRKQEVLCEELGNKAGLQISYGNQATVLYAWGRLKDSMVLYKKKEALCEELGDRKALQWSYGNEAVILHTWGRLEEAMVLLRKQEALCEELGTRDSLHRSYGNQALILKDWGRLEEAMALHKKQETLCEELGNKHGLQASYGNQALILRDWDRLEEAMALLKKQEILCQELGNREELQRCYGNQALILRDWGRLKEAMALHKRQESLCKQLGNKDGLQASYGNQALILAEWGRLDEALTLHRKEEVFCKELGDKSGLAYCYWHWGLLAREMKEKETAREKLQAALAIFAELKMPRERDAVQAELSKAKGQGAGG